MFASILDQTLAQGRLHHESFGSGSVVTLQGIAEALLVSNCFWHCLRLHLNQDHRAE